MGIICLSWLAFAPLDLRRKFYNIHHDHSPVPRTFYSHFTSVTVSSDAFIFVFFLPLYFMSAVSILFMATMSSLIGDGAFLHDWSSVAASSGLRFLHALFSLGHELDKLHEATSVASSSPFVQSIFLIKPFLDWY